VLKKRLALVSPTVVADAFMYEEGADLDADETAENAAHRPVPLAALPGGGIRHGSLVAISDQAQAFEAQLVVSHRVSHKCLVEEGM
jgi:Ubiquitin/SUMO-activating enzyme ubiquitin-like domain